MKIPVSDDKLRGGYYTPALVAEFLANWAIQSPSDRVLEPSCGDGAIAEVAARRLAALATSASPLRGTLTAIELHAKEATKARTRLSAIPRGPAAQVLTGDFFTHCSAWTLTDPFFTSSQRRFDAVVGNPPFVRYQNFPETHRALAFELMRQIGLRPNRLTNAWVPFLVMSALVLSEHGRLAMVIPAELLQVSYAAEVRLFLSDFFARVTLITFRKLLFEPVQQDVVLLLAEKGPSRRSTINVLELDSADALRELGDKPLPRRPKLLDHSIEKWTRYFLTAKQLDLLRLLEANPNVSRVGAHAQVDVGVVTGENAFFVLTEEKAREYELRDVVRPLVSRTAQLRGLKISQQDWADALARQAPVLLFTPPDRPLANLPAAIRAYIKHGEKLGVHRGYKCGIRKRWYIVPSQWVPDAFALRQVHNYPRIVVNSAQATATDTLHRLKLINGQRSDRLATAFTNSLTFAFSEVTGRGYGGGVLTFEPSEIERLPIPLGNADALDAEAADHLMRSDRLGEVLDQHDKILLIEELGLSKADVQLLRKASQSLRERRHNRRR